MYKAYKERIKSDNLKSDDLQQELVLRMARYSEMLLNRSKASAKITKFVESLIPMKNKSTTHFSGIYIWGDAGRGKSMVMDIFFENIPLNYKQRFHFHEFMLSVHKKIKECADQLMHDPLHEALDTMLDKKCDLLCFDELQVNNIADAMTLGRMFQYLFDKGVFVTITSNRAPDDLFKDGLQRERFMPFIELIKKKTDVFHLDSPSDYRIAKTKDLNQLYFYPLGADADKFIKQTIKNLIGNYNMRSREIYVQKNKKLNVKKCYKNIALFTFAELFEKPLGAIDYIAICKNFNTVILQNIKRLSSDDHNEALRFITFIDCLYENKIKLICSCSCQIDKLYKAGKNDFEFQRTISRLHEMQSKDYSGC